MAFEREEAGSGNHRRPPSGFLGMVGFIVMIELFLSRHSQEVTALTHWDWRSTSDAVTRADCVRANDLLIFGDSVAKFEMLPGVIRTLSGKKTRNFAVNSGQSTSTYLLFRRALEAGATPTAVVLDATSHMVMYNPRFNMYLWPELLSVNESFELSIAQGDADFMTSILLAQILPSYHTRHEIRSRIRSMLDCRPDYGRDLIAIYRRNWKVNDGAQLESENPAPLLDPDERNRSLYPFWLPDPVNMAYLDRFLSIAESKSIPVYWLLPAVQQRNEISGFDVAYEAFVRSLHSRFLRTIVVDARRSNFRPDDFMDVIHLNRRGASRLSAAFSEFLRDSGGAGTRSTWVALDLDRASRVDLPMEDLVQSAEAIRDEGHRARR